MAASKFWWYTTAMKYMAKGRLDLEGGTIKAFPLRDSYSPSTASHSALAQLTAFQVTASATVINALALSSLNITGSGADTVKWDAADIDGFSAGGATIPEFKYLALYEESASSGGGIDNLLIGFIDLDTASASASAGNTTQVNIQWNSLGIGKLKNNQ